MRSNRIPIIKSVKDLADPTDLRAEQVLCKELGEGMVRAATGLQKQISGQVAMEGGDKRLIVIFSAFPNGDLIIWFCDKGYFQLMALVNQKFKHIATFPSTNAEEFQKALTEMQKVLGQ